LGVENVGVPSTCHPTKTFFTAFIAGTLIGSFVLIIVYLLFNSLPWAIVTYFIPFVVFQAMGFGSRLILRRLGVLKGQVVFHPRFEGFRLGYNLALPILLAIYILFEISVNLP